MTTTLTNSELIDFIYSIETLLHSAKINMAHVDNIEETNVCYELALSNIVDAQVSLMHGNESDCKAYLNLCADMIYGLGNELHYSFDNTYRSVARMCFVAVQAL